jgi:serine protease Do
MERRVWLNLRRFRLTRFDMQKPEGTVIWTVMRGRRIPTSKAWFVLALVGFLNIAAAPIQAQLLTSSAPSRDAREKLYREIADEVAALEKQGNILKRVVTLIKPTVVHIEAKKTNDGFGRRAVEEAGSGVVVDLNDKHYVLTNRHVIKHTALGNIHIRLADGREISPVRSWADSGTDVAIMEVDAPNLIPARLGDSDHVAIGDFVLAVGSPFGLSHSVTYGIISAKGRRDLQLGAEGVQFQDFFQTDAAINPGNSGGPLLNLRGEVIGINTAIASSSGGNEGIGFTIPINMAMFIARQLVDHGSVMRAFLGVTLDSQYDLETARLAGLTHLTGARVKDVTPNSAAAAAQLQVGDIILSYDGVRIENDAHLINQVSLTPVGKEISLLLIRNRSTIELKAKLGTRYQANDLVRPR